MANSKFTGVTGLMLKQQAEARRRLEARHKAERKAAKSYRKRTARAAAAREKMKRRQERERAALLSRQAYEREEARNEYAIRTQGIEDATELKRAYEEGLITLKGFRAVNLRQVLLTHNNLSGKDKQEFEAIVNKLSMRDLVNLGEMYRNVLETWIDSGRMFSKISDDLMKQVRSMANMSISNIRKMLTSKTSALDEATMRADILGWNPRLETWESFLKKNKKAMGY